MEPYSPHGYPSGPGLYPPPTAVEPLNRYTGGRTPSPTPSEVEALTTSFLNVKKYMNWRFWARKDWIIYYIGGVVLVTSIVLITVFDKQIVHWLTPAGRWMKNLKFGWLIPIAVLFIISFPPLFGHEIVAILCGVIWGLSVGFAILAAGTFLGEIGNFYAFKYCCRARGEKMEKTDISYACLARVVREGGFKIALIIRLSIIPGHFSTAVFSTCGMGILVFALAAFFSLPKQLIGVYIGVILEQSGTGTTTTKNRIISDSVLAVTFIITLGAGYYIWREINRVKPAVIYDRRKARQVKIGNSIYGEDNGSTANLYAPADSEVELPLSVMPQRPARFVFTKPQRQNSGNYAGEGGYMPSYAQGQYGEALGVGEERKSTEIVGWETRGPRVDDMRGARWGVAGGRKDGHASDDEEESEEATVTSYPIPPALPPPPAGPTSRQPQQAPLLASPNLYEPTAQQPPRHAYEISDPPVTQHTPLPSSSTSQYAPSLNPPPGYAQTDILTSHSQGPSAAYSYESSHEASSMNDQAPPFTAPQLGLAQSHAPISLRDPGRS